jgi:hypothetical protein
MSAGVQTGSAADDSLAVLLVELGSQKYMKHEDRSIWAATVKEGTVSILDSDDQFTPPEAYTQIADRLVADGAVQVGSYTISHIETFQAKSQRRDSVRWHILRSLEAG